MALEPVEILNGAFSIVVIIIATIQGFRIMSRYFKYKQKVFFYVGLSGVLQFESWWPSAISFLNSLITGEGLSLVSYLFIGNFLIPVAILSWLVAFTDLLYEEKQKIILFTIGSITIIFEILFISFLFLNPSSIGELQGTVDIQYTPLMMIYLGFSILITLITGILFARETMKSEEPELKLKGKLILIAFITFTLGALLDSAIPLNPITLPITRIILIISSIAFYGGFILPEWMKKILLRNN